MLSHAVADIGAQYRHGPPCLYGGTGAADITSTGRKARNNSLYFVLLSAFTHSPDSPSRCHCFM